MGIQYAGGVNRNDLHTGITTPQLLCLAIRDTLVAAGWTSDQIHPWQTFWWNGQPLHNQLVLVAGIYYTAREILTGAYQFLIDTTPDQTYQNFKDCINANPATAGIKYGAGTVAHPSFYAGKLRPIGSFQTSGQPYNPGGYLRIQSFAFGARGDEDVSSTTSNATWYRGDQVNGIPFYQGFWLTSAVTPQGHRGRIRVYDGCENFGPVSNTIDSCRIVMSDACELDNEIVVSHFQEPRVNTDGGDTQFGYQLRPDQGSNWRVIANKYQFAVYIDGTGATNSPWTWVFGSVPAGISFQAPKAITGATNATPIVVTSAAHGYLTNDVVCIRAVLGNLAANGNWVITRLDDNRFSLNDSAGNGAYTSGGIVGKINQELAEIMFLSAWGQGGGRTFIRGTISGENGSLYWQSLNGETMGGRDTVWDPSLSGGPAILTEMECAGAGRLSNPLHFYNQSVFTIVPLIGSGTTPGSQFYVWGQLWDAQIVHHSMNRDVVNTAGLIDGHNWKNLTAENPGASTSRQASLIHVIP